jgi:hypothetical protein
VNGSDRKESDRRWRGAMAGGGKLSQVEGSYRRWRGLRGATAGGGERSQVEASDRMWRRVIAGGRER